MRKNDLCKFLAGKVCVCAAAMLTTIPVYGNNEADSLSAERRGKENAGCGERGGDFLHGAVSRGVL